MESSIAEDPTVAPFALHEQRMLERDVVKRAVPEVRFPAEEFDAKEGVAPYSSGGGVTKAFGLTALGIIGNWPPPGCGGSANAPDAK